MSGDQWSETIVISKSKLNKMTIISGLASYLSGLSDVVNQVHLPQDTGSGYQAYNLYAWDGMTNRNLSNPVHTHSSATTGGDLAQMAYGNPRIIDTLPLFITRVTTTDWETPLTDSGCTVANDTGTNPFSIKTTVGTTINTRAVNYFDCFTIRYDSPVFFQTIVKFNTLITNMVWNMGTDPEDTGDTAAADLKALFEYCSSVNSNYFIACADGTTRTSSDTGVVLDTTNERALRFLITPATKIDWKVYTTVGIKTTNVPDTGNSANRNGIVKAGQKTTAASASKSFNHWGFRLIYTTSEALQT